MVTKKYSQSANSKTLDASNYPSPFLCLISESLSLRSFASHL